MASVAAVQADLQRPLLPDNLGDPDRERTGLIGPKNSPLPDKANEVHDPAGGGTTRKIRPIVDDADEIGQGQEDENPNEVDEELRQVNGDQEHDGDGVDADLFGDDLNDEEPAQRRQLDDEELDSGDDLDRNDRAAIEQDTALDGEAAADEEDAAQESYLETEIARHGIPHPSDGELYLLKVPRFLSMEPRVWDHTSFQPPTSEHHSRNPNAPSQTFSPFTTATTTLRWRRSPSKPQQLQSNARILRWSDGSLTLQLANNPEAQYELPGNPLAFPQQNPLKPTPTSVKARKGRGSTKYDQQQDSFTYLCAPAPASAMIRVTNKVTTALNVLASSEVTDDALERLQSSLAAAGRGNKADADGGQSGGIGLISIHEDPELAKKKAEVAEKEKLRAQRRREAQEQRERDRTNRVLGRSGLPTGGGLTAAGLEDDELGMGYGRPRAPRGPKKRKSRRDEIYTDDEDEEYGRRGRTKEDEYDEEDDFVARSDEEEEVGGEDDDEDIDEGIHLGRKSPKRRRETGVTGESGGGKEEKADADAGGEEDAEGEVDEDVVVSRAKRRRVIEEDEDE